MPDDIALPPGHVARKTGLSRWMEAPLAALRSRLADLTADPSAPAFAARLAAVEADLRRLEEMPERVVPLGDRLLAVTHAGRKIFLDVADIGITPHIALTGVWERETEEVVRRLLRPGATAIEVGANMGYHTLAMADAVGPEGRIHAFEANPAIFRLLDSTVQVNGLTERVTLHNKAALSHRGEVEFAIHPDHCGSAHYSVAAEAPGYSSRVATVAVPLDEEPGAGIGPVHMIRMDAEGSEPLVLRGAAWLLARSPEVAIVTEWAPGLMSHYADVAGFVDWLGALGFRAGRILPDATLQPMARDALLSAGHVEVVFRREA